MSLIGTDMNNLRIYGSKPYSVVVVHGGPGAPGEMAPVAREISKIKGVLEPLQTATTLNGQIRELKNFIQKNADIPVILIGRSWGAWLSFIVVAQNPSLIKKLILIGSGSFEERYTTNMMNTRLTRLSEKERGEIRSLMKNFNTPSCRYKNAVLSRFGVLISKADSYDPLPLENEILECNYIISKKVWEQASALRRNGKLLELGEKIQCPVVAIHGDYDPHLPSGVEEPLCRILKDFRFILLKDCGHKPWNERKAKSQFYDVLKNEIRI